MPPHVVLHIGVSLDGRLDGYTGDVVWLHYQVVRFWQWTSPLPS